jgi:hypothetical protein
MKHRIAGGLAALALLLAGCGSNVPSAVQSACSNAAAKFDALYAAASAGGGPMHRANIPTQAQAAIDAVQPVAVRGTVVESAFTAASSAWSDYAKAGSSADGEDDPNLTAALVDIVRAQDGVVSSCRDAGVEMKVRDHGAVD